MCCSDIFVWNEILVFAKYGRNVRRIVSPATLEPIFHLIAIGNTLTQAILMWNKKLTDEKKPNQITLHDSILGRGITVCIIVQLTTDN